MSQADSVPSGVQLETAEKPAILSVYTDEGGTQTVEPVCEQALTSTKSIAISPWKEVPWFPLT